MNIQTILDAGIALPLLGLLGLGSYYEFRRQASIYKSWLPAIGAIFPVLYLFQGETANLLQAGIFTSYITLGVLSLLELFDHKKELNK